MPDVTFSFDPACPWTWKTSRWLVSIAAERDLTIDWRAFSLSIANEGNIPDEHRVPLEPSRRALRLIESLRAQHRTKDIERLYAALGQRAHEDGRGLDADVLREAIDEAGVDDAVDALDDAAFDRSVQESHAAAFAAAGPDIGSPVIQLDGHDRGIHGPIVSLDSALTDDDALALWDATARLITIAPFYEIKRGR